MIATHREIMFIILMRRTEATEKTLSHGGGGGGQRQDMGGAVEFWVEAHGEGIYSALP